MGNRKGWLGGVAAEMEAAEEEKARLAQRESSQKVYEVLKKDSEELSSKRIGLDGEPIEPPISYSDEEEIIPLESPIPCSGRKDVELPKKGSSSLGHVMRAVGILSSLLREIIAVGVTQSWDTSKDRPEEKFVDIEGERLKETVERLVPRDDRNLVYRILQDEVFIKKGRDRIAGNILLKFAFPYCS